MIMPPAAGGWVIGDAGTGRAARGDRPPLRVPLVTGTAVLAPDLGAPDLGTPDLLAIAEAFVQLWIIPPVLTPSESDRR
jgi:hypothetical protein